MFHAEICDLPSFNTLHAKLCADTEEYSRDCQQVGSVSSTLKMKHLGGYHTASIHIVATISHREKVKYQRTMKITLEVWPITQLQLTLSFY